MEDQGGDVSHLDSRDVAQGWFLSDTLPVGEVGTDMVVPVNLPEGPLPDPENGTVGSTVDGASFVRLGDRWVPLRSV